MEAARPPHHTKRPPEQQQDHTAAKATWETHACPHMSKGSVGNPLTAPTQRGQMRETRRHRIYVSKTRGVTRTIWKNGCVDFSFVEAGPASLVLKRAGGKTHPPKAAPPYLRDFLFFKFLGAFWGHVFLIFCKNAVFDFTCLSFLSVFPRWGAHCRFFPVVGRTCGACVFVSGRLGRGCGALLRCTLRRFWSFGPWASGASAVLPLSFLFAWTVAYSHINIYIYIYDTCTYICC